jgi:hypothetical protein
MINAWRANLSAMDQYPQIAGTGVGDVNAPMREGYTTLGSSPPARFITHYLRTRRHT